MRRSTLLTVRRGMPEFIRLVPLPNPSYFAAIGGGGRSMIGLWLKNPRGRR
jgi:hypothetical protein